MIQDKKQTNFLVLYFLLFKKMVNNKTFLIIYSINQSYSLQFLNVQPHLEI